MSGSRFYHARYTERTAPKNEQNGYGQFFKKSKREDGRTNQQSRRKSPDTKSQSKTKTKTLRYVPDRIFNTKDTTININITRIPKQLACSPAPHHLRKCNVDESGRLLLYVGSSSGWRGCVKAGGRGLAGGGRGGSWGSGGSVGRWVGGMRGGRVGGRAKKRKAGKHKI